MQMVRHVKYALSTCILIFTFRQQKDVVGYTLHHGVHVVVGDVDQEVGQRGVHDDGHVLLAQEPVNTNWPRQHISRLSTQTGHVNTLTV